MNGMFAKVVDKLGISYHDLLVVCLLIDATLSFMYTFLDGADLISNINHYNYQYHPFVIVQKIDSVVKLLLVFYLLFYQLVVKGNVVCAKIYVVVGVSIDVVLGLVWIVLSMEESWPLSPFNVYGIHYIVTFGIFRALIYACIWDIYKFIYNDMGSFGNVQAVRLFYQTNVLHTFSIVVIWDVIWNCYVVVAQEMPEILFDYVFVGVFGSMAMTVSTELLGFRILRIVLNTVAIYLIAIKSRGLHFKIWGGVYGVVGVASVVCSCFYAQELQGETDYETAVFIVCFFTSNFVKVIVLWCCVRVSWRKDEDTSRIVQ